MEDKQRQQPSAMQTTTNHKADRTMPVDRGECLPTERDTWSLAGHLSRIAVGGRSLFSGLALTLGYFLHPGRIITQQYPENRETLAMFPRFRGRLVLVRDEQSGLPRCTACGMCEKACPNGTISVLPGQDGSGKKILGKYIYRLLQCTLCNLCVETCPFGAIAMGQDFELAAYDRQALVLVLHEERQGTSS